MHYWKIDNKNNGFCLRCGEERDFKPDIIRVFGEADRLFCKGITTEYMFSKAEYYMQGTLTKVSCHDIIE